MLWIAFAVVFLVFLNTKTVFAYSSFGKVFAGKIIHTKDIEIQTLEFAGYICPVFGSSISIIPMGSPLGTPTSYFIPFGTYSKTGYSVRTGQLIMGKYSWKTPIACVHPAGSVQTVWLDTISLFGTSR